MNTGVHAITVAEHRPDARLDAALSVLAHQVIAGWPDQRPVTPALVRSRLHAPPQAPATIIATHHTANGVLVGAAALRHPEGPHGTGRLWGPIVHPAHRRRGLGRALVSALPPDVSVTTAEIPTRRTTGTGFFAALGWRTAAHGQLLTRTLPVPRRVAPAGVTLRPGAVPEDILSDFHITARPHMGTTAAHGTAARWARDERYDPAGVWSAWTTASRRCVGVALVYPLAPPAPHEEGAPPGEVLLADLLVAPEAPYADDVRLALTAAALNTAHARTRERTARCVVDPCIDPRNVLIAELGFSTADFVTYRPETPEPAIEHDAKTAGRWPTSGDATDNESS